MIFAEKIKLFRKDKGWTQADLAEHLNIHREQISSYERGQALPTTEILMQLSNVFSVSIDYLLFENEGADLFTGNLKDLELVKQFEKLDKMNARDRRLIKEIIDLAIVKNKIYDLVSKVEDRLIDEQIEDDKQAVVKQEKVLSDLDDFIKKGKVEKDKIPVLEKA